MNIKLFFYLSVVVLAVSLTACGTNFASEEADLEGTSWVLYALLNSQPIEGTEPTITFKNGQVSGNASCNSYGGGYTVNGDRIQFDALFMTEMFCMEPEGIMDQENTYIKLLGEVEQFSIEEGKLMLFFDGGKSLGFDKLD